MRKLFLHHLINNAGLNPNHENESSKLKLIDWHKNKVFVAMVLSNYTLQVNFFVTHFKVIFQGQFNCPDKVPFLPTSPVTKESFIDSNMSVISNNATDVCQPFKIIFINAERNAFELNPSFVLSLLRHGPKMLNEVWNYNFHSSANSNYSPNSELKVTLEELYDALVGAHAAMHSLNVFSDKCYHESSICQACVGNPDSNIVEMNPSLSPITNEKSEAAQKIIEAQQRKDKSNNDKENINPNERQLNTYSEQSINRPIKPRKFTGSNYPGMAKNIENQQNYHNNQRYSDQYHTNNQQEALYQQPIPMSARDNHYNIQSNARNVDLANRLAKSKITQGQKNYDGNVENHNYRAQGKTYRY